MKCSKCKFFGHTPNNCGNDEKIEPGFELKQKWVPKSRRKDTKPVMEPVKFGPASQVLLKPSVSHNCSMGKHASPVRPFSNLTALQVIEEALRCSTNMKVNSKGMRIVVEGEPSVRRDISFSFHNLLS